MKPLLSVLTLLAFITLSSFTGTDDNLPPYQVKSFKGNLTNLRVETSGGSISVEGGQSAETKVEMYVRPNNWFGKDELSKDEIAERLKEYDITLDAQGGTIIATAKRKNQDGNWSWKNGVSISFKVYTPRNMNTDLRTSGGSIRLANLTGQQNFATSGGSLNINTIEGNINGRTSGGSITMANCRSGRSGERIDMRTSGGSITASESTGDMHLTTSGGSVRMTNLKGQIDAHTSGGSVQANDIDGSLKTGTSGGSVRLTGIAGSVDASTSGGSIEAEITRLGDYVRLSGSAGSVRVRMPLNKGLDLDLRGNRVSTASLSNFDGSIEKTRVTGRLNGGGIPVKISSASGSVYLND